MKRSKKMIAALLSAVMLTGMFGSAVNAAGDNAPAKPQRERLEVVKTLQMDPHVENYPDFKFKFTLKNVGEIPGGKPVIDSTLVVTEDAPEMKKVVIDYSKAIPDDKVINPEDGRAEITLSGEIVTENTGAAPTGTDFPKPGLYLYQITEEALEKGKDWVPKTEEDWLDQSKAEYILIIPVVYDENTQQQKVDLDNVQVVQIIDQGGKDLTENKKVTDPLFVNVYQRDSDPNPDPGPGPDPKPDPLDPKNCNLKIHKTVTGELGDREQLFDFRIHITRNTTEKPEVTSYEAAICELNADGRWNQVGDPISVPIGKDCSFQLKDSQYLIFKHLPVGSSYKIWEDNNDGYDTTADIVVNGEETQKISESDLEDTNRFIGEKDNKAHVYNHKGKTPLTGIITDNLSFLLLIVVAVVGIFAYTALKKRLRKKY